MRTGIHNNSLGQFSYNPLRGIKMLIIDDDDGLCNSLKYFFEDNDCLITTAKSAEEGLELLNTIKPDVVIVDLNMPGMGGHEFINLISKDNPHLPIIVISGTGIIKDAIVSINHGAWDFIGKPIMNFKDLHWKNHL